MPVIKHFYRLHGDDLGDLARRMKDISDELALLNRVITHGKQFAPANDLSLEAYRHSVANQINALNEIIKGVDFGLDHYEISERMAEFNLHSLTVLEALSHMKSFPDLDAESDALQTYVEKFEHFVEKLSADPSRKEVIHALHESAKLLGQISTQIESTRENPLVAIAECWFEGAEVAQQLTQAPTIRPSSSPKH